jgi:NAD+ kinase
MKLTKIAFVADETEIAQSALNSLKDKYPNVPETEANIVVALGGDGFMLETLHTFIGEKIPVFGMNCGTIGFLLNSFSLDNLLERIKNAETIELHPLEMHAKKIDGTEVKASAINEVSLLRETRQTAKIKIYVDDILRMDELVCDGVLVSTAAGSTAYNLSAHGPIIPIGTDLLALTPISAFRPRRWRGALLRHDAQVRFEIISPDKRPVSAVADSTEVRDVEWVTIREDKSISLHLLFDKEQDLKERIIQEQFLV